MKIYSHEGIELYEHLNAVNKISESIEFPSESWRRLSNIVNLLHDFGKSTRYFQEKILNGKKSGRLADHSKLSSLFAVYICEILDLSIEDTFIIVSSIRFHHSNLSDILSIFKFDDFVLRDIKKQVKSIDREEITRVFERIGVNVDYSEFCKWLEKVDESYFRRKYRKELKKLLRKQKNEELFFKHNFIFSVLIDSDKIEASQLNLNENKIKLENSSNYIKNYKHKRFSNKNSFSEYRESLSSFLTEKIKKIDIPNGIYSIVLPTGAGKTLLSYQLAFELLDKFDKSGIFYILPFTSVIDQNYEVLEDVLTKNNVKQTSETILKHHWLSNSKYISENIEEENHLNQKLLVESWRSVIVISTFIQFFESLIAYKNKNLKKFNKYYNRVIILDEIQNVPVKYWNLIETGLEYLSREFNCSIIFITATKPLICENCTSLFHNFDMIIDSRVKLSIKKDIDDLNKLADFVIEKHEEGKRVLVILNTITSAVEFYDILAGEIEEYELEFLSSHISMKERKKRLTELDDKRVLISTQIVEAGMDLDFEIVIRDFAPLDSIIQSAGRCNRHKLLNIGKVFIVELENNKKKKYSKMIYDEILLSVTKEVMRDGEYYEEQFNELIEEYFRLLKERKNIDQKIIEAVYRLDFDCGEYSVSTFSLIDNDYKKSQLFLMIDEESEELWEEMINIIESDFERWEKKNKILKIKDRFYEYVISVSMFSKDNLPFYNEKLDMYYLERDTIYDFYSEKTGKLLDKNYLIF